MSGSEWAAAVSSSRSQSSEHPMSHFDRTEAEYVEHLYRMRNVTYRCAEPSVYQLLHTPFPAIRLRQLLIDTNVGDLNRILVLLRFNYILPWHSMWSVEALQVYRTTQLCIYATKLFDPFSSILVYIIHTL